MTHYDSVSDVSRLGVYRILRIESDQGLSKSRPYRGTARLGPPYVAKYDSDHPVNKGHLEYCSMWDSPEPFELDRAASIYQLYREFAPEIGLDLVEVLEVENYTPEPPDSLLGFDIVANGHIWSALVESGINIHFDLKPDLKSKEGALLFLLRDYVKARLNDNGLLDGCDDAEVVSSCLKWFDLHEFKECKPVGLRLLASSSPEEQEQ